MPRKENGPVPQQEELSSDQPKLADVYRPSDESLDIQQLNKADEQLFRTTGERLGSLQQA